MKAKVLALLGGLVIGSALMIGVGAVHAGPPNPVGAHRHFIEQPDGTKVYVGPNFCEIAATEQGFAGFHHKVHVANHGLADVAGEACPI